MMGTSMPQSSKSRPCIGSRTRQPVSVFTLSGRTMLASEPIMSSGDGGSLPAAAHRSSRAANVSARLRAIKAGHPPGSSEPM